MELEKPKLFLELKDFLIVSAILILLILIRLWFFHNEYQEFISKPFYYTTATVTHAHYKTKYNKRYQILKLHSEDGLDFFTTTDKTDSFVGSSLRLITYPDNRITFAGYMGHFYLKSEILSISKSYTDTISSIQESITKQHEHRWMKSLYSAIYLATPLDRDVREKISSLGVSHLIALSGFHLGILWWLLYTLLYLPYHPLQQRWFPYRYSLIDIGIVTISLLGYYIWLVGYPPSLLRSYAMLVVGWIVILLGIELVSFEFLSIVSLTLILAFPHLLFSLGFILSIMGVFYIFLLLRHTQSLSSLYIKFLIIPFGIYLLMTPFIHLFFGMTTPIQLLSPLLSLLFTIFYPMSMILHLLGIGYLLDNMLLWLLHLDYTPQEHILSWQYGADYILLSLGSIWSRRLFAVTLISAMVYLIYLYIF